MNKFVRYMVIIFAVIVCTAFIIYAGNLTGNPEDSSSQSSEEMNESPITEDGKDKEDIKTEEGQSSELTDEKHSHQAIEYWLFDENIHWKECVCGETLESEFDGERVIMNARVPVATSLDYATTLASLTGGRGAMSVKLHGYEPCPLELGAAAERRSVDPLDTSKYILAARSALEGGIFDMD